METTTFEEYFRPFPEFAPELVEKCKNTKDFMPLLFEWYKYMGIISNLVAAIAPTNPNMSKVQFAIFQGMLNRCSRLMLSSIRLAVTDKHGESVKVFTSRLLKKR